MPRLTDQGLQKINNLAQHYGVSADAVMTLLQALLNSKGTMAQFDPKPSSRNAKILAAQSVPLRTNLKPKPKALARLWGLA